MNFNMPSAACNSAITAEYTKSNVEKEITYITNMYKKKADEWYNDNRTLVYSGVFVGGLYNTVKTQELKVVFPILPIANQVSVDVKPNDIYSYNIEWKVNF